MARTHSEVQERKAGGHQDIEEAGVEGMLDLLYPERLQLYSGPGAVTIAEMKRPGITRASIVGRAGEAVAEGKLVEVRVERLDDMGRVKWLKAWVPMDIYQEWENRKDNDA